MAGCNVRQGADSNFISVGNARARLRLRRQRTEQSDGRFADALEFGQQVVHTARIGLRFADVIVLLETAQLAGIAAREAQRPVVMTRSVSHKCPSTCLILHFPGAGAAVAASSDTPDQELPVISKLLGEKIEDRALGNAGNVVFVELSVFGGIRDGSA